jgi:hypothetical protein
MVCSGGVALTSRLPTATAAAISYGPVKFSFRNMLDNLIDGEDTLLPFASAFTLKVFCPCIPSGKTFRLSLEMLVALQFNVSAWLSFLQREDMGG